MAVHILADNGSSFYGEKDDLLPFWKEFIGEANYGWHVIEIPHSFSLLEKLKEKIEKLLSSSSESGSRIKQVIYGDTSIKLNLSSEPHQKAFFLIHTFNGISKAIKNGANTYILLMPILLMPDYDEFYDRVFDYLKNSLDTTSIVTLTSNFGSQVNGVINDLTELGVIKKNDNFVSLTELAKELPFLIGKGSTNSGTQ